MTNRMHAKWWCCLLLLCGSLGVVAQPVTPGKIVLAGSDDTLWISASAATTTDGSMDLSALGVHATAVRNRIEAERQRGRLTTQAVNDSGECPTITITTRHLTSHLESSWRVFAANAAAIYRGRVTAVVPGFEGATPRSLVAVEITNVLRRGGPYPQGGTIFTTYPTVDFRIAGHRFCNRSSSAFMPAAGDEILILAFAPPRDTNRQFLLTDEEHLVFSRDGALVVSEKTPFAGELTHVRSMAELESHLDGKGRSQ